MDKRYNTQVGGEVWTQYQHDQILTYLTATVSQGAFDLALDSLAERFERGHRTHAVGTVNGELVRNRLWKLLFRYQGLEYTKHTSRPTRGGDATFGELLIIKMAEEGTKSKECQPVDIPHLANILGRTIPDTERLWAKYGPAKGRVGFSLPWVPLAAKQK